MIYIFDFDNTLFQTEHIKQALFRIGQEAGLTADETKQVYAASREQEGTMVFTLEHFCHTFKQKTGISLDPTNVRDQVFLQNAVTPGAEELLSFLQTTNQSMFLLSLGNAAWQGDKVTYSGIEKYFTEDHIFYTSDIEQGKRTIIHTILADQADDHAWLFNDKPDETAELLEAFPFLRAYVVKNVQDSRYGETDFTYIQQTYGERVTVHTDLTAALSLIKE